MFVSVLTCTCTLGKAYSLEGVMVMSGRQGFKPAQVTLKRTLLEYSKNKGFAANFTDFKVQCSCTCTFVYTHSLSHYIHVLLQYVTGQ